MIVSRDITLSSVLWYRIGGPARYLLEVRDRDDLSRAVEFVEQQRPARVLVIGLGANLLMPDHYFDGAVIRIAEDAASAIEHLDGERITVFGGALLSDLALRALDQGLTGLEWAGGLPGTVGAGVRGNVGAFGGEIEQTFQQAEVITFGEQGCQVATLNHAQMNFSYRESRVKREPHRIVAAASFDLRRAGEESVALAKQTHQHNIDYRQARHPMEYPNCGSVFKNLAGDAKVMRILAQWPDIEQKVRTDWHGKVSMGYIIGRLGLAGKRVGGAEISTKHHNFIVNLGSATSSDVRTIIRAIQDVVAETFGLVPEVEIEIIE
jgi:UDP-N-acetylmuramate dehydrogenase